MTNKALRLDISSNIALLRQALVHLDDLPFLETHPLNLSTSEPGGKALHRYIIAAIEELRPEKEVPQTAHAWRGYHIMRLRYIEGLEVEAVRYRLAIGSSEFHRDHRQALDALLAVLERSMNPNLPRRTTLISEVLGHELPSRLIPPGDLTPGGGVSPGAAEAERSALSVRLACKVSILNELLATVLGNHANLALLGRGAALVDVAIVTIQGDAGQSVAWAELAGRARYIIGLDLGRGVLRLRVLFNGRPGEEIVAGTVGNLLQVLARIQKGEFGHVSTDPSANIDKRRGSRK